MTDRPKPLKRGTRTLMMTGGILCSLLAAFPAAGAPAGYELVWADEFDYTGGPDPAKWTHETGGGGWGNQEKQVYTDSLENSRVEDGHLIIEVQQDTEGTRVPTYTSARLVTRDKGEWKYGRMEVRAKLPEAVGTWSAIWMLAAEDLYGDGYWPDNGEIDIMENVGYESDPIFRDLRGNPELPNIHATLHTEKRNHLEGGGIGDSIFVEDPVDTFHTYALTWDEGSIVMEVDGTVFHTVILEDIIPRRNPPDELWPYWPFDQPFFLILNIAIGGSWGGVFNTSLYPESPYGPDGIDHDAEWPQRMLVDYVRVYQKAEGETWKGWPVDANGDVNTDSWLGWINVLQDPWIYSYTLQNWIYPASANDPEFTTDSQWLYILKP